MRERHPFNLLLNIGPRGDGTVPEESVEILNRVGTWLGQNEAAIFTHERFEFNLNERAGERSDFTHHGKLTANGNHFYLHVTSWPGAKFAISGLECTVKSVTFLANGRACDFRQERDILRLHNLPETVNNDLPIVLDFHTADTPCLYRSGGWRNPAVPHCRYDPLPSDIKH